MLYHCKCSNLLLHCHCHHRVQYKKCLHCDGVFRRTETPIHHDVFAQPLFPQSSFFLSLMSGERLSNCDVILHGMTTLRNRHHLTDKPFTYIYNGLFSCVEQLDRDGVGLFHHFIGKDASLKQDRTYEISAMVIAISYSSYNFCSNNTQIAPHQPGHNMASDEFTDEGIDIMGNIHTVCLQLSLLSMNLMASSDFKCRCNPLQMMMKNRVHLMIR